MNFLRPSDPKSLDQFLPLGFPYIEFQFNKCYYFKSGENLRENKEEENGLGPSIETISEGFGVGVTDIGLNS